MEATRYVILAERGVLAVGGPDARPFVQGLISNDIDKVAPGRAIYATLLTPQGKFLHDFFVAALDDALVFDCEGARLQDLERRLVLYRLRAKVTIEATDGAYLVAALTGEGAHAARGREAAAGCAAPGAGGGVVTHPRPSAGRARAIVPRDGGAAALEKAGFTPAPADDYDRLRLAHALPDGSHDMLVDKGFLLENGIDRLNGVDFDKGCYVGQELVARTKHRASMRKHIYRVDVDGPLPEPGTPVRLGAREVGEMRSGRDRVGLALLRVELVERAAASGERLIAGDARLTPVKPAWAA